MIRAALHPLAWALLGAALGAQTTVLEEDFSTGVPPAGWSKAELGWPGGWADPPFSTGAAYHDDYYGGMSDSYLVTPELDFTGMTEVWLHAKQTVGWPGRATVTSGSA